MRLLEKVCKELDVKTGEGWLGNDGNTYSISEDGTLWLDIENSLDLRKDDISRVLVGELRPVYRPTEGDMLWVIDLDTEEKVKCVMWIDDSIQYDRWLERGMVFKSKEEATEVADELLKMLRR